MVIVMAIAGGLLERRASVDVFCVLCSVFCVLCSVGAFMRATRGYEGWGWWCSSVYVVITALNGEFSFDIHTCMCAIMFRLCCNICGNSSICSSSNSDTRFFLYLSFYLYLFIYLFFGGRVIAYDDNT